jgi:endonuclease YncB( thermonuclease family)
MPAPEPGLIRDGKITRILDGDTLEVEFTTKVRIRLRDCWAAETNRAGQQLDGFAAKDALEALIRSHSTGARCRTFVPFSGARNAGEVTSLGRALGDVWLIGWPIDLKDGNPPEWIDPLSLAEHQVANGVATQAKPKKSRAPKPESTQ